MKEWELSESSNYQIDYDERFKYHILTTKLAKDDINYINIIHYNAVELCDDLDCKVRESISVEGKIGGKSHIPTQIEYELNEISQTHPVKFEVGYKIYLKPKSLIYNKKPKIYKNTNLNDYKGPKENVVILEGSFIYEPATYCTKNRNTFLWLDDKSKKLLPQAKSLNEKYPTECRHLAFK